MKKLYVLTSLLFCFYFTTQSQNTALSFDGVDDFADFGNDAVFDANNIRTMECWVKFSSLAGAQEILSKSDVNLGLELLVFGNNLAVYAMNAPNVSHITYPASNLGTGIWYHIAFSWDGTKESMRLYVNGISVGTRFDAGDINTSGLGNPGNFRIGQWSNATSRPLNGQAEEVRLWNVMRTEEEIRESMYNLAADATGLIAYYKFDEAAGATVTNELGTPNTNGTLINGPTWTASPVQQANNSLFFDGVNDRVIAPANAAYNFTTGTVEARVRPGVLEGNAAFVANMGDGVGRWSFHMANEQIGLWNGVTWGSVPFEAVQGQWYHVAFVCTPTQTLVYVDGEPIGSTGNVIGNTATGFNLAIGENGNGGEPFNGEIDEVRIWNVARTQQEIQSTMDLSINSPQENLIANFNFNQGVATGDNTGLVTAFDRSITANNGTLMDFALTGATSNYLANTLQILPVKLSAFTATRENQSVKLQWTTEQEQNSESFIVERSSDGTNYRSIGSVAAAGTSNASLSYSFVDYNPARGVNYYRLKQTDLDGKYEYSAIRTVNFITGDKLVWHQSRGRTIDIQLGNGRDERFVVTDINGRIVKQGRLDNGRTTISALPAGTFVIAVQRVSGNITEKIMVR